MRFRATLRTNGFFFVQDLEANQLVGVRGKDGKLKPKKFKTTTKVVKFIASLEEVVGKEKASESK